MPKGERDGAENELSQETINYEIAQGLYIEVSQPEYELLQKPMYIEARLLAYVVYNQALLEKDKEFGEIMENYRQAQAEAEEADTEYRNREEEIRDRKLTRDEAGHLIERLYSTAERLDACENDPIIQEDRVSYPELRKLIMEWYGATGGMQIRHDVRASLEAEESDQVLQITTAALQSFMRKATPPELPSERQKPEKIEPEEEEEEKPVPAALNWRELLGEYYQDTKLRKVLDNFVQRMKGEEVLQQLLKDGEKSSPSEVILAISCLTPFNLNLMIDPDREITEGTTRNALALAYKFYKWEEADFIHPDEFEELAEDIRARKYDNDEGCIGEIAAWYIERRSMEQAFKEEKWAGYEDYQEDEEIVTEWNLKDFPQNEREIKLAIRSALVVLYKKAEGKRVRVTDEMNGGQIACIDGGLTETWLSKNENLVPPRGSTTKKGYPTYTRADVVKALILKQTEGNRHVKQKDLKRILDIIDEQFDTEYKNFDRG